MQGSDGKYRYKKPINTEVKEDSEEIPTNIGSLLEKGQGQGHGCNRIKFHSDLEHCTMDTSRKLCTDNYEGV